jgi:ribosomal protein S18 acetylase RimI-like enzyme
MAIKKMPPKAQVYRVVERTPSVREFLEIRKAVGWGTGKPGPWKKAMRNSLYSVCVLSAGKVIGTARVVGDESMCFYIQDVIVMPEHQKRGVGLKMMKSVMKYMKKKAGTGATVGLMSVKGKEGFYKKFGFWKRPNRKFGYGMMQFWKKS